MFYFRYATSDNFEIDRVKLKKQWKIDVNTENIANSLPLKKFQAITEPTIVRSAAIITYQ
jgi:hypothetical protein